MLDRLKRLFRREPDLPPVALVALETTPRVLSRGGIAGIVARVIGKDYPLSEVREDGPARHRFAVAGYVLTLLTVPQPYIPKDRAPDRDLVLRDVIERQEAAVLLDCWAAPPGRAREDATDLMGRILVELIDEASVGMYCFHTQRLNPTNETLVSMFREGRAYEAMNGVTFSMVSGVRGDDPGMLEAIDEARRRWPEFVAAFDRRQTGGPGFAVKAPFGEGDRIEHLWIEVEEVDFERASGRVVSRPLALPRPRQGDRVTVLASEVSDWSFVDGEAKGGSFSDAIVRGEGEV